MTREEETQSAIEWIEGLRDGWNDKDNVKYCNIAIKALEQTRWIPVGEQLPKDDGYYLVTFQRNLLTRTERYTSISEFREGSWTEFGHVVAWMPFPEPYQEESEKI